MFVDSGRMDDENNGLEYEATKHSADEEKSLCQSVFGGNTRLLKVPVIGDVSQPGTHEISIDKNSNYRAIVEQLVTLTLTLTLSLIAFSPQH